MNNMKRRVPEGIMDLFREMAFEKFRWPKESNDRISRVNSMVDCITGRTNYINTLEEGYLLGAEELVNQENGYGALAE